MLLLERGVHDSLDGVHAVLGLVEDLGSGALEDLVGDLLLGDAELLALLGAMVVLVSWKLGRQCRKMAPGLAIAMTSEVTRYGVS